MKKVLKLTATSACDEICGQFVDVSFQLYKEGLEDDGSDVIIYRKEDTTFVFDYDYDEYFDCILPDADDIIFKGKLEVRHTFCEYRDFNVEVGKTYIYWVGRGEVGKALTGPIPVKVRDRRVWWHFDEILQKTYSLKDDFPSLELVEVGKTVFGKPLIALLIGNKENMIATAGAVHAGESGPEILLTALREILSENPSAFDECGIAVLPVVNADMREKMVSGAPYYIRKNAGGVDLNRNFDADWERVDHSYGLSSDDERSPTYRGARPNSEPEVQALISFTELTSPRAVFSYHFLCSISSDRLLSSALAANDEKYVRELDRVSKEYSVAFRSAIGAQPRPSDDTPLICSSGSYITWLYKRGITAYDLEMSMDLTELTPCKYDKSTFEMLCTAIKGHKAALLRMISLYEKR